MSPAASFCCLKTPCYGFQMDTYLDRNENIVDMTF